MKTKKPTLTRRQQQLVALRSLLTAINQKLRYVEKGGNSRLEYAYKKFMELTDLDVRNEL